MRLPCPGEQRARVVCAVRPADASTAPASASRKRRGLSTSGRERAIEIRGCVLASTVAALTAAASGHCRQCLVESSSGKWHAALAGGRPGGAIVRCACRATARECAAVGLERHQHVAIGLSAETALARQKQDLDFRSGGRTRAESDRGSDRASVGAAWTVRPRRESRGRRSVAFFQAVAAAREPAFAEQVMRRWRPCFQLAGAVTSVGCQR